MTKNNLTSSLAPKALFEQMLEYLPIPTFDLVIQYKSKGVIILKRTIAPYKNVWALPGLRMFKGETINDTIRRVAKQELCLTINPENKIFVGQFVGKFSTEHNRQDISTCYAVTVLDDQIIHINSEHFSKYQITNKIPKPIGAMYKFYLENYFSVLQHET